MNHPGKEHRRTPLSESHPELCADWHWQKNGALLPTEVTRGSAKKVWWHCNSGHEWRAAVHSRARGNGCPFCSRKRAGQDNNLTALNPKLSTEWHPTRNGELKPNQVTPGSSRAIWWLCPIGHEWRASVHGRNRGRGCPKCRSSTSLTELRILAELRSVFGEVTHREKHAGSECDIYLPKYKLAVEYDGLRWHSGKERADRAKNEALRTQGIACIRVRQDGLPRIESHDLIVEKRISGSLETIARLLRTIDRVCQLSAQHQLRIESYLQRENWANDVEYQRLLQNHPFPLVGLSLQEKFPNLAQQWHPTNNNKLTPSHVFPKSGRAAWWRCGKGHEWQAKIAHRANGSGCPICSGRQAASETSLTALFPAVAAEWHPHRNVPLMPDAVRPRAGKKVWWQCKSGHEWNTTIASRVGGSGCPYCAGQRATTETSLAALRPKLVPEWHKTKNANLSPRDITVSSNKKVWWICKRGHEWQAVVGNRSKGIGCPFCSGHRPSATHNLLSKHPTLASEWHPTKNGSLKPSAVVPGSHTSVWWLCSRGHEWQSAVKSRVAGTGCPYCAGRRFSAIAPEAVVVPLAQVEILG